MLKWKLMVSTLPVVLALLGLKLFLEHVLGFEGLIDFSDVGIILTSGVFLIGFLLADFLEPAGLKPGGRTDRFVIGIRLDDLAGELVGLRALKTGLEELRDLPEHGSDVADIETGRYTDQFIIRVNRRR